MKVYFDEVSLGHMLITHVNGFEAVCYVCHIRPHSHSEPHSVIVRGLAIRRPPHVSLDSCPSYRSLPGRHVRCAGWLAHT